MWDILWLGVVYGIADALLLNVLPVVAVWRAFAHSGWTTGWPGKLAAGASSLVASLGVTAAYHLGYPEFQGPQGGFSYAHHARALPPLTSTVVTERAETADTDR